MQENTHTLRGALIRNHPFSTPLNRTKNASPEKPEPRGAAAPLQPAPPLPGPPCTPLDFGFLGTGWGIGVAFISQVTLNYNRSQVVLIPSFRR